MRGTMKIGIIGAGNVGRALGKSLVAAGHDVVFGLKEATDPRNMHDERYMEIGEGMEVPEAVAAADVVILATPWQAARDALERAGDFGGKVLIDATNPLGPGFTISHDGAPSGAELVAKWARDARVVKCFNTTGFENMKSPAYGDQRTMMLAAGEEEASEVALGLARDIGFEARWLGDLSHAHLLEAMALVWIKLAFERKEGRFFAFGMLHRDEEA